MSVLFLFVLLGVLSLVLDAGMAYSYRRYMQNAADSAVLAGGALLAKGITNDAQIVSTATYYGQANKANSLTIQYLDAAGNLLGQAGTGVVPARTFGLKVIATYRYTPGFAAVLGVGAFNITAEAKGGLRLGGGNAVILALGTSVCPGLNFGSSGSVTADGGGIQVNAPCDHALDFNGSGEMGVTGPGLYATRSGGIFVNGGVRQVGSGVIQPAPMTGVPPIPDPLSGVVPPNIGSYPVRNGTATVPSTLKLTGGTNRTLDPGVYYGGISATGNGITTLRPGIYIIAGGELTLGGSGVIVAQGVFFYLTNDPTQSSGMGTYARANINGGGNMHITPMTSGPYRNLTFFQDRNSAAPANISGGGEFFGGTCYFPHAPLTVTGNAPMHGYAQLIADSISFKGSGDMSFSYDANQFFGMPEPIIID
jgi:hypothetical protein